MANSHYSASIVEYLLARARSQDYIVLYFFCSFGDQDEKHTRHFLMSLAAQLVSCSPRCFDVASRKHKDKDGNPLLYTEYLGLVESFVSECHQVVIVVDGLDEIWGSDGQEKEEFVRVLNRLLRPSSRAMDIDNPPGQSPRRREHMRKAIVTSREDHYVRTELAHQGTYGTFNISFDACDSPNADLEHFVFAEIQQKLTSGKLRLRDGGLAQRIQSRILQTAGT